MSKKARLIIAALAFPLFFSGCGHLPVQVLESEQRTGYQCRRIAYSAPDGDRVEAYLLVPDGAGRRRRHPGLVLLHDHGARFDIGKEKLVRPMASAPEYIKKSSQEWVDGGFDGVWFADRLAAAGYVVIVPDALYWGSRSTEAARKWSRVRFGGEDGDLKALKKEVYEGQRAVYDSLERNGVVWACKTLREDAGAAAVLGRLPCVDPERIGCFGWSMGAHRAWLLTAFCPEVKTGVALCWMTLKQTQADPPTASDYSMMIPQLRERYDFPDIALALAPKPFLFLSGRQDKLFPEYAVEEAYGRMRQIYSEKGADGMLLTEWFDGPHHCGLGEQERIMAYLDEHLKP